MGCEGCPDALTGENRRVEDRQRMFRVAPDEMACHPLSEMNCEKGAVDIPIQTALLG